MSNFYDDDPMYTGEMDPQAMIDFLVANGVGAGLLPQVQPSGKPMTVSNITGALSANRSGLFDTAFMGLGGEQAFAPGAFEPTVTQTIVQTPELQQIYGYLRSPDSVEGLIANEIMNGGTPSTAVRKIRELLADETTDPALRDALLLELPQRPVEYGMPAPDLTVENVNWDADENSVAGRAREIGDVYAQVPRIGPSGPKWDPATGQQISAGGELQWSTDESGAPVMVEVTSTPSEAAQTFTDLGLPTPDQQYGTEDFLSQPVFDRIGNYQNVAEPAYDEAMAQWLAANEAARPSYQDADRDAWQLAKPGWGGAGASAAGPPLMASPADADALNRYQAGSGMVGTEGGRVVELPNWEVDPYSAQFGGQPINMDTDPTTLPVPAIPPEDIQRPGFDYTDWVPPVDRDEDWQSPTNAVGEVDELGGIYYGNDYTGTGQAGGNVAAPGAQTAAGSVGGLGGPVAAAMLQTLLAPQRGGTTPPTQPRPISASDQLQNQAQAESRAPDWLSLTPGSVLTGAGGAQAPNPVTANGQPIDQYNAEVAQRHAIETGERSARIRQREADEQSAQVLGGSTDRTGKRVRPTRTGQQAREYRYAHDQWVEAFENHERQRQNTYGYEFGAAAAQAGNLRRAGVRPLDQALMARRLVMMNAGVPQGF